MLASLSKLDHCTQVCGLPNELFDSPDYSIERVSIEHKLSELHEAQKNLGLMGPLELVEDCFA